MQSEVITSNTASPFPAYLIQSNGEDGLSANVPVGTQFPSSVVCPGGQSTPVSLPDSGDAGGQNVSVWATPSSF